ncbi:hypothetical protein A3B21_02825 [Candidatus Uhrbacteria bacterium RIFCSPLOWO2_01_FULL_47_24]|uniref:Uncharacterized protein n=1 Tax=Candidatus Uhrbacteria bacterium RIFCSPLOWO2_01_FULL_47_24 TaxID=1802401 RepID=A0A1F7UU14_9BACT|nr:MAG: hypothetical protein A3B21_02825 [Candidatus Uhrbacteria bacterium RIFCSPLOWO2_01_FULL_47_24]OGL84637.1 MAG: hypothetical protein A3J03_02430 [Candidatus Uhrbacteria bacterium RIFCSPLOWO2_02_FULL_46_25]OGL93206.1 MAG: hypothetical protein A3H11_01330 [Candidatus Uhrbacteria bacterium RIFCSPLOWO2_12_FULL_47_10]
MPIPTLKYRFIFTVIALAFGIFVLPSAGFAYGVCGANTLLYCTGPCQSVSTWTSSYNCASGATSVCGTATDWRSNSNCVAKEFSYSTSSGDGSCACTCPAGFSTNCGTYCLNTPATSCYGSNCTGGICNSGYTRNSCGQCVPATYTPTYLDYYQTPQSGSINIGGSATVGGNIYTNAIYSGAGGAANIWMGDSDDTLQVNGNITIGSSKSLTLGSVARTSWPIGLPAGTSGQTLRHDGTNWVANSILYNNGTNVGIGTTTPGTKLDVVGTLKTTGFQLGSSASVGQVLTTDASGVGTWQTSPATIGGSGTVNTLAKFTGGTVLGNSQIVDDGVNTGIGTMAPDTKLHITGGNNATLANGSGYVVIGNTAGGNVVLDSWGMMTRSNGGKGLMFLQNNGGDILVHNAQGGSSVFSIKDSGRVGVGTSSPEEKLEVWEGSAGPTRLRIRDMDAGQNPELQLYYGGTSGSDHWAFFVDKANNNSLTVWQGSDISGTSIMELDSLGNLTVMGNTTTNNITADNLIINAGGEVIVPGGIQTLPSYTFTGDTNTGIYSGNADTLRFSTAGASRLEINSSGDVTINSGNALKFTTNNVAAPSATDSLVGTRLLLYPNAAPSHYAIGVQSSNMWFNSYSGYKFYSNVQQKAELTNEGTLDLEGGLIAGTGNKIIVNTAGGLKMEELANEDWDQNGDGKLIIGVLGGVSCANVCASHGLPCWAAYTLAGAVRGLSGDGCSSTSGYAYCWCGS